MVIGGSSGIGAALVDQLQTGNCRVYASFNQHPKTTSEAIQYFQFDAVHDTLPTEDLPDTIDGLVYCPGSITLKPFHRFTEEQFIEDFKLQVTGATKEIQQLLPQLKASQAASIVLFSTVAVQRGFNFHSQVAISKGAIEGLTKALAAEFAPTIRVNAIAPSLTDTPLAERLLNTPDKIEKQAGVNPMKRVGNAADIAEMAHFLLTSKSSWVTGQIIAVDGGFSSLNT